MTDEELPPRRSGRTRAKPESDEDEEDDEDTEDEELTWLTQGHEWIGKQVRRDYGDEGFNNGKITKWVQAGKDPKKDPALWHVVFEDEDEEDLEAAEVREAVRMFDEHRRATSRRNRG